MVDVSNEIHQFLTKDPNAILTNDQINKLIDAIIKQCGRDAKKLKITRPTSGGGGGGGGFGGGNASWWWFNMWDFWNWLHSIPVGGEHLA